MFFTGCFSHDHQENAIYGFLIGRAVIYTGFRNAKGANDTARPGIISIKFAVNRRYGPDKF
jgi:hypothetical protein